MDDPINDANGEHWRDAVGTLTMRHYGNVRIDVQFTVRKVSA